MATQKKEKTKKKKNKVVTVSKKETSKPVTTPQKKVKKKKKRGKNILNVVLIIFMIFGIVIMCGILIFCGYIVISAPAFNTDLLYNKETTKIYDKNGNEMIRIGAEKRELKTYEELPQVLIDAIVATEDSRYFQHNGFDIVRFSKASLGQLAGNSNAGGASTLTMQVVKNTFTSTEAHGIEGIIRKFTDIYMSVFKIEKNYTKEEIIEFYVNAPFLGMGTFGVEQACQTYFGKSVNDITLAEASLIAGIFNAPSAYNPFNSLELAEQRRATVLNLMVRHGYITQEQADDAKSISVESLITEQQTESIHKYQSFIDVVIDDVMEETGNDPYNVPMQIYTTIDPDIQDVLVDLNNEKLGYKWKDDYIQIGMAITDVEDGSILAINGDRTQSTRRAYNRATEMKTQPGSTIKPIIDYGPYIEYNNGSTGSIFYDVSYTYSNGQKITNSDNSYKGAMTMRQALIQSRNIPALQAFQAVDKDKIATFVNACGIDYYKYDSQGNVTDKNLYESYSIGGGMEVSPLDMAAAYATFARGGYYIKPYSFTKIIYQQTDEEYIHKYEKVQAMSKETAYMITDMLVSATKAGVGGNLNVSGTEIASKTGTSTYDASALKKYGVKESASADNWVITYSPDYVISFWYGYDKLSKEYYTDSIEAAIQRKKISAIVGNKVYKKNSKFTKPSSVISSKYEKETIPAELPSEFTPASLIGTELFKKGTEPSEVSKRFSQLDNPTNGNAVDTNGTIELSWKGIGTPDAINQSYLQNYFKDNYGKQASTYLNRRINYNESTIGTIGYQVYLSTANGLEPLTYTTDTSYTYTVPSNGTYTFVIKSAYSIFKSNESSGLTISAECSTSVGDITNETPDENETPSENDSNNSENNSDESTNNSTGELEGAL